MHQLHNNLLPKSIRTVFIRNDEVHDHFTRQCAKFHQSFARTTITQNTVRHEGSELWNSLEVSIKSIWNIRLFKRNLRLDYSLGT